MGDAIAEGMTLDRTNDYTRQYADAVKDVAWQVGVGHAVGVKTSAECGQCGQGHCNAGKCRPLSH